MTHLYNPELRGVVRCTGIVSIANVIQADDELGLFVVPWHTSNPTERVDAQPLRGGELIYRSDLGQLRLYNNNTATWVSVGGGGGGGDAQTADPLSQFAATTSAQLAGVISDETGSGALVFANTPTLVTPVLGVASATSINKLTVTAPATGATLTIADGATLTVSSSATVSGSNTGDQTIGLSGDVTGSGTGTFAATIANGAVTYAKMQDVSAASKLLGRGDSGSGDPQEITLGANLTMTGTTLAATGGGGVTGSGTDEHVARWDGTGDIQDSNVTINDAGTLSNDAAIESGNVGYFRNTDSGPSSTGLFAEATGTGAVFGIVGSTSSTDNGAYGGLFQRGGDNASISAAGIDVLEMATPDPPPTGFVRFYAKTDNSLYFQTDGGSEVGPLGTLSGDVTTNAAQVATIANDAVTYAKMQNVSATDMLLGRSTAGAGNVEEIPCTAAGRALLDDASASDQRTTLGLGSMATQAASAVAITGGTIVGLSNPTVGNEAANKAYVDAADVTLGTSILSFVPILNPSADTRNVIQPSAATVKLLTLRGFASQSDDHLLVETSASAELAKIDSTGKIFGTGLDAKSQTITNVATPSASTDAVTKAYCDARTDGSIVTLGTDGDIPNERILTGGDGILITDGGAGSTVTVSARVAMCVPLVLARNPLTNIAAAVTEYGANNPYRIKIDLTDASEIRISARVSVIGASSSAVLFLQYSTDESAWSTLTSNQIALTGGSAGVRVTTWEAPPAGALGDVFVRMVTSGGDGAADPEIGNVYLQVR